MEYPENWSQLTKSERKEFKRNYYQGQQSRQLRATSFKKYGIYALLCLIVLGGGYLLIQELSKPQPGIFVASLGNKHIQNVTDAHDPYNSIPPTSGTHVGGKAQWGISDTPLPDELQLHNLEDGGVAIQYNCTSVECSPLINSLSEIAKKYPDKVIMAPYPKLDAKIALTAWTRIDKFNEFDSDRIHKFIKAYRGIDHH